MKTRTRLSELLILSFALCCIFAASDLSAAVRRKKIPLAPEPVQISEAFYDKAWRDFQIGNKKEKAEVIKSLRAIVRKSPEEFMAHYYLGIMISQEGSPTQALRHFETALLGFPKSADIHVRMGELLDARNKSDEAIEHYESALALEPGNGKALSRLGMYQLEQGNLKDAREMLTKARQVQPDDPNVLRGLGAVLIDLDSAREAIEILEQALLFDQKHAETHWLLARAYESVQNADKAAEHYETARKLGRRDPEIKELIGYDLARNLEKSGKVEEAIAEYKKEIRKNADPATGYFELGRLYEDMGRYDEAIKSYLQAYNMNKDFSEGIMRSAEIYLKGEDFANAENFLNMLRRDPKFGDQARMELDEIEETKKRLESRKLEMKLMESDNTDADIEATYYELIDRNKEDAEALDGLRRFYEERGYYNQALAVFRKYYKVNPGTAYGKEMTEKELKDKFARDNLALFGTKKEIDPKYSSVSDEELMNLAYNGENDRLREVAIMALLTRKEYKKDRKLIEELMDFYEERGNTSEALKCVTKLKRYGYYTDNEASAKRDQLRGK
ncbi:MAG: tetratricopeptide repeat protein [Candidatus Riflebacteria bacterium]|nr:tetratricopeptide repeat protein [Candidatus Riflebacteria bacterium]